MRTSSEPSGSIAVKDVEFAIAVAVSVPIIDTLEVQTRMNRVFPKPLEGDAGLPLYVDTQQFPGFSKHYDVDPDTMQQLQSAHGIQPHRRALFRYNQS